MAVLPKLHERPFSRLRTEPGVINAAYIPESSPDLPRHFLRLTDSLAEDQYFVRILKLFHNRETCGQPGLGQIADLLPLISQYQKGCCRIFRIHIRFMRHRCDSSHKVPFLHSAQPGMCRIKGLKYPSDLFGQNGVFSPFFSIKRGGYLTDRKR